MCIILYYFKLAKPTKKTQNEDDNVEINKKKHIDIYKYIYIKFKCS